MPSTSQIPPFSFLEAIDDALMNGETPLIITMSSKLSGTYQSACTAAADYPGRVFVVDSENVTVGEQILVEHAFALADAGMGAGEIAEKLNTLKPRVHLAALLDTLEYLKRGGRISKAAAFAGGILSIKPVVGVVEGRIEVLGKARGTKQGNAAICQQVEASGGIDFSMPCFLGYTGGDDGNIQKFARENARIWSDSVSGLPMRSVGCTIGTHVGPGAVCIAWVAKE